jgi:Zn-dependent peptidase ImmA (M78 family)
MKIFEVTQQSKEHTVNNFVHKFAPWVAEQLGIKKLPKIELLDQPMNTSFGTYDADNNCLYLVTAGRHPIDVLRTLAHELTHHKQNLAGQLDMNSGDTGTDEENEANANAGIIMRDFASANPEYFGMDETIQVNKPTELAVQQNYTPPKNPSTKKINATPAVKIDIRNSKPDPDAQTYKPK